MLGFNGWIFTDVDVDSPGMPQAQVAEQTIRSRPATVHRTSVMMPIDVACMGLVCHWLSQLHPKIRMQLGKASEPKYMGFFLGTRPNANAQYDKAVEVLGLTKFRTIQCGDFSIRG